LVIMAIGPTVRGDGWSVKLQEKQGKVISEGIGCRAYREYCWRRKRENRGRVSKGVGTTEHTMKPTNKRGDHGYHWNLTKG